MDHDKAVRVYLKMRAKRTALKREYEAADAELQGVMTQIENALLGSLIDNKVQRMGASEGTFFIEKTIKPSCNDWHAYHTYIKENDAFEGLEKRVTKSFVVDFMKNNDNDTPPGIIVLREQVCRIRATSEKA